MLYKKKQPKNIYLHYLVPGKHVLKQVPGTHLSRDLTLSNTARTLIYVQYDARTHLSRGCQTFIDSPSQPSLRRPLFSF